MSRPGTVLLVDPDVRYANLLAEVLGADPRLDVVGTMSDLHEAVAATTAHPPDLLLVDVRLPRTEPRAAIETLREASPSTRIVVLAEQPVASGHQRLVDAGASGVVWKGERIDALVRRTTDALVGRPLPPVAIRPGHKPRTGRALAHEMARPPRHRLRMDERAAAWTVAGAALTATTTIAVSTTTTASGPVGSSPAAGFLSGIVVALACVTVGSILHARRQRHHATEATQQLRTLLAQQDSFVAIASHELRTPVTVVGGFATTLDERWTSLDEDTRRMLVARMATSSSRLRGLLEDLQATALAARGSIQPVPTPLDVADVVRLARHGSLLANVDIDAAIPEGLIVHADPSYAPRMLANLLDNAHKYGAPPYVLRVWRSADRVEFSVRDHGPGVPDHFVADLFRPFTQAEEYQRRHQGGIGLGLHTVARLAELSGGTVRHHTPPDGGAEFILSFPIPPYN